MPTQEELAGMDNTIESLKTQISAAKEELKHLSTGINLFPLTQFVVVWLMHVVDHNAITNSLPTDEIQARIIALDNEVLSIRFRLIVDYCFGRCAFSVENGNITCSYKGRARTN
jgi:hypothetical protein